MLFAAGWFLYEPAYNWIMDLSKPKEPEVSQAETVEPEVLPQQEPQQPAPMPETWAEEMRAVWIPASAAANSTVLESYLSTLPGDPVNTVVLELKDAKGRIFYQSGVEAVKLAGAQTDGALDLAAAAELLHQKGASALPCARQASVARVQTTLRGYTINSIPLFQAQIMTSPRYTTPEQDI